MIDSLRGGGGGGGGNLVLTMPGCVCPKVKGMGPFRLQGSEISVKFAASLNMCEYLCKVLYIITYESSENELRST